MKVPKQKKIKLWPRKLKSQTTQSREREKNFPEIAIGEEKNVKHQRLYSHAFDFID